MCEKDEVLFEKRETKREFLDFNVPSIAQGRMREREGETETETDRQTDRQTDRELTRWKTKFKGNLSW